VSVGDAGLSARAAQVLYAYARAVDEGDIEALRTFDPGAPDQTAPDQTAPDQTTQTRLVIGQYSDSLREVDGQLRFSHKRITVERVVAIPAGTSEYAGVPPVPAGTTIR